LAESRAPVAIIFCFVIVQVGFSEEKSSWENEECVGQTENPKADQGWNRDSEESLVRYFVDETEKLMKLLTSCRKYNILTSTS
jgi:hypothetical protein